MKSRDAPEREVPGERIAARSAAMLRLGLSHALAAGPQENANRACAFNGRRCSLILSVGEARVLVASRLFAGAIRRSMHQMLPVGALAMSGELYVLRVVPLQS